jgi:hypothetical protein
LGLPYDPAVFEFYRKKEEVEKAYLGSEEIMQVHRSLFNPVSKDRLNGWKKEMTPRQVRMADLVAGRSADKAGYVRQYTSRDPLLYLKMLPILTYAGLMYRLILFGDHLPFRMRNGLNRILGVFLKVYWKINKREIKPL